MRIKTAERAEENLTAEPQRRAYREESAPPALAGVGPTVAHCNPALVGKFQFFQKYSRGFGSRDEGELTVRSGCISMEMHRVFLIRSAP
jgi:hypothetical protein